MKIPVIIPVFNAERWFSRQSDSLLPHMAAAGEIAVSSGSADSACSIARARAGCVRPLAIPYEGLCHGGTHGCTLHREYWYNEENGNVTEQYRDQLPGTKAGFLNRAGKRKGKRSGI